MTDATVTLLATGGTIASIAGGSGRSVAVSGAELLAAARRVWDLPKRVEVLDVAGLISSALRTDDLLDLARRAAGVGPVVITHGTDAMEETAFALAMTRSPTEPPVVLTGAQRPFDDPCPDGARNLAAAIRWAASDAAIGTGVAVAFGDRILPAIGVRKTHTVSLTGFEAPGRGPFAVVDEGGLRRFATPTLPHVLLDPATCSLPRVDIVGAYVAMSLDVLEPLLARPGAGVVVAGMGSGNMPPLINRELVDAISAGVPVVVTSRTGAGSVAGLYAGGGADLAAAGAVFAGDLSPVQARLALAGALRTACVTGAPWRDVLQEWLRAAGAIGSV